MPFSAVRNLPSGCTSVAELNRALKELEHQVSHGSLTLKQEKAVLEQMRELKKGKALIAAYEEDQKAVDAVREEHSAQQAELKPVNVNLDQLKASATEKGEAMDKLMAARTEQRAARDALKGSHEELKGEIDRHFEQVPRGGTPRRRVLRAATLTLHPLALLRHPCFDTAMQRSPSRSAGTGARRTSELPQGGVAFLPRRARA